ncbi:MAG: biliverdin-producing heme oxygenase [Burkholderiales bacterium]|nr:biliverdin-producing heme oxygenase [Burkholderiales bacterium]
MNHSNAQSLSGSLKAATTDLHRLAERSPFMTALLRGDLTPPDYLDWFAALLAIYETMERSLPRHASLAELWRIVEGGLARAEALRADVAACSTAGPLDSHCLPAVAYAKHLEVLSEDAPILLAAHVYVRYLGDLQGGRLMALALKRSATLPSGAGAFSEYSRSLDMPRANSDLKSALDALGMDAQGKVQPHIISACAAEAATAFGRHIDLFAALEDRRQTRKNSAR